MPKTLQFKLTLLGSKPAIVRRLQVMDDYRLDRFHQVIQIAMGWHNSHLHEFDVNGQRYGMPENDLMDDFDDMEDETKFFLKDFNLRQGDQLGYLYDFGDSWEHRLEVEAVTEGNIDTPLCLKGKGACPPEDCGGVWGYRDIIKIIKNPKHPEYDDWAEWLPENFDPAFFDLKKTNAGLQRFGEWHNKHPKDKSTPWHQI